MNRQWNRQIVVYVASAMLLFIAGWHAHGWYSKRTVIQSTRRVALQGFRFTSPLLDVELPEGMTVDQEPMPFKHRIASLVKRQTDQGLAREIAVYYRDLHDGPWFGINEDKTFHPASMMKVVEMIAWLKRAEKDPKALQRTFVHDGKVDMSALQELQPRQTITFGRRYTVDELLSFMMNYSDNNATALLFGALTDDEIGAVLDNMDVNNRIEDDTNALTIHGLRQPPRFRQARLGQREVDPRRRAVQAGPREVAGRQRPRAQVGDPLSRAGAARHRGLVQLKGPS